MGSSPARSPGAKLPRVSFPDVFNMAARLNRLSPSSPETLLLNSGFIRRAGVKFQKLLNVSASWIRLS